MTGAPRHVGILCVDDNAHLAAALKLKFSRAEPFVWKGWIPTADGLVETVRRDNPSLVLLDLDMPGADPFEAITELADRCPETRVIVFSGHVRADLIDRAMEAGAWGYASKNDGEDALLSVLRGVLDDEVAYSPEVRATYDGR